MKLETNCKVGIYCRLSRDEAAKSSESVSIENQRAILTKFVSEREWELIDAYIDDGYTGTNFERPDFKRMIRDCETGRINCVVTKDSSRLGRNRLATGIYKEDTFVRLGVRYLTADGRFDNADEDGLANDFSAFQEVIDEWYPRHVSRGVRRSKRLGAELGKFMNSKPAFGYEKSQSDRHILVPDEAAAAIVRRLFEEYAGGKSTRMIADCLNVEGVDCPSYYFFKKNGKNPPGSKINAWGSESVHSILENRVYIGDMVSGKRQMEPLRSSVSGKRKMLSIAPENWIIVEGTHAPLVSRELWERVQAKLAAKYRVQPTRRDKVVGLFAGLLRCAECGSPLAFQMRRFKGGDKGIYKCSRYNNNGGHTCTPHYIDEISVKTFVLNDLRRYAAPTLEMRERLAKSLMSAMGAARKSEIKALQADIAKGEQRLDVIAQSLKSLYIDKATGKIPEAIFLGLMNDLSQERDELEARLPKLRQEVDAIHEAATGIEEWLALVEELTSLEDLSRDMALRVVDKVVVHERVKGKGGSSQELEIFYRFVGSLPQKAELLDAAPVIPELIKTARHA